jgi:predicted Zn-dependent protease
MLLLALPALSGCTELFGNPPGGATGQASPVDQPTGQDAEDAVIGQREHPRIIATYGGIYTDRPAEIMLAHIVGRLLTAAGQPNTQYTITVLDTADVNAFALPGGYIYVTRGILALANDTSEIAAVMAHEIAHVVLHHARARSNKQRTDQLVDRVMTGVLGATDDASQQQRSRLAMAAFSQQQELEADQKGIEIASAAGYDPFAASRFLAAMGRFSKFSSGDASQVDDFLSSHPSTPDRIQKATAIAQSMPAGGERDRAGYMAAIDGLSFGASPQQGTIVGQRYIQPALKFTFTVPEGYKLQNAQGAVVGIAGDSEAVRFDSAEVPQSLSLTDYLKSGWIAGLDPNSVDEATVNGMDTASGTAKTDQWSFRVSVARFQGEVVRFIFAAKADSQRFQQGAAATLASFRPTTAADLGQIRKVSVKAITAKSGDTAASLALRMASMSRGIDLFYVLNNLLPGDPVVAGQQYKIVTVG